MENHFFWDSDKKNRVGRKAAPEKWALDNF